MTDNALRCIEEDYPALVGLAQIIGVLDADGNAVQGCAWDYIGYKVHEDGSVLMNDEGKKYVHVNVRTPFSIGAVAMDAAAQNPEIASALGDPSRFFVTDAQGNAVDPQFPMRVFL